MASMASVAEDMPDKGGIPQENLAALKAFLAAKREQKIGPAPVRAVSNRSFRFTKKQEDALDALPRKVGNDLRAFIASIQKVDFLRPVFRPLPEWKVFYGDSWAEAKAAAQAAVYDFTGPLFDMRVQERVNAAEMSASLASLGASKFAAREDIGETLRDAVYAAIKKREKILGVPTCAGGDAGLMASLIMVSDLNFDGKEGHVLHAKHRWEVWQNGYGLQCDIDGVLYAYCKGKAPK